jgi:hypothetical protein
MAEKLSLTPSLYAEATPAGAYYAVASRAPDSARKMLTHILKEGAHAPLTEGHVLKWAETDSLEEAMELLYRLQRLEFVQGAAAPRPAAEGSLEATLPGLLERLSDAGRALLADDNGFYLASAGFRHEAAEEIAALAGDILALGERHALLLKHNLNIGSSAWAICDAAGRSELGFYSLHLAQQSFVLILGGTPQLQGEDFVVLVEALVRRYA